MRIAGTTFGENYSHWKGAPLCGERDELRGFKPHILPFLSNAKNNPILYPIFSVLEMLDAAEGTRLIIKLEPCNEICQLDARSKSAEKKWSPSAGTRTVFWHQIYTHDIPCIGCSNLICFD